MQEFRNNSGSEKPDTSTILAATRISVFLHSRKTTSHFSTTGSCSLSLRQELFRPNDQARLVHRSRRRHAQQVEDRRRDRAEYGILPECGIAQRMVIRRDQNHRYRIGRVRGERAARNRIDHLLGIAMVGRQIATPPASSSAGRIWPTQPSTVSTACTAAADHPGMAHHVAVGEVDDDEVVGARPDRLDDSVAHVPARSFPAGGRRSQPWAKAPVADPRQGMVLPDRH